MKQFILALAVLVCGAACGTGNTKNSSPSALSGNGQTAPAAETHNTFITCTINGAAFNTNHPVEASAMEGILTVGGENDSYGLGIDMTAAKTNAGATFTAPAHAAKKMTGRANIGFQPRFCSSLQNLPKGPRFCL